jgi:hypothetical protein
MRRGDGGGGGVFVGHWQSLSELAPGLQPGDIIAFERKITVYELAARVVPSAVLGLARQHLASVLDVRLPYVVGPAAS